MAVLFTSGVGVLTGVMTGLLGSRALMVEVAAGDTWVGALPEAIRDCWLLSRDWRSAGRLFCGHPQET